MTKKLFGAFSQAHGAKCSERHVRTAAMKARTQMRVSGEGSIAVTVARSLLWLAWQTIRIPLFSLLLIFEPIVRCVLSWLTLWSFAIAFVWEFSGVDPLFPFLGMITFSFGCALALAAYHALLRLFG